MDKDATHSRRPIYIRAVSGMFTRIRRNTGAFFLSLFALIPWMTFEGHQAILLDISAQQFRFFATTLWPQDFTLLAIFLILAAFALFFITTFFGRIWCGYLCPQTVWVFTFLWFEEKLEGPANKRRKQDAQPLTRNVAFRKTIKHLCWLAIALFTGLTFIGYFQPIRQLFIDFFTGSAGYLTYFWVLFFTFCTYGNAGWMREIMCLHICPYARLQSVMFDKDTLVVGYDSARGEQRGARQRKQSASELGLGDCIDCNLCVQVCPTGIDIRDGLQYECINCGACVDACNNTMEKMGYAKDLIAYTSERKLEQQPAPKSRPKLIGYGLCLLVISGIFAYSLLNIQTAQLDISRGRNSLYKINDLGDIENTYHLKIINKTQHPQRYQLSVTGLDNLTWYGKQDVLVQAGEVFNLPISLSVPPNTLPMPIMPLTFTLIWQYKDKTQQISTESRFIGK